MIKHLIANGCSFTEDTDSHTPWPRVTADHLRISSYHNLALGGSGNYYIATSTIEYLESHDFIPEETLVLIMWSGISRKDWMISQSWADYFRRSYNHVPQRNYFVRNAPEDIVYYLCSGGHVGSWLEDSQVSTFFHPLYRVSSPETLCKESLHLFLHLQNYLLVRGYKWAFTTFMNLWYLSVVDQGETDFRIGSKAYSLTRDFDFSHWFFTDDNRNGFAEFALQYDANETVDGHPSELSHARFAKEIVLPSIERILI